MKITPNPIWYAPESGFWGERYIQEHKTRLTDERTRREVEVALRLIGEPPKRILDLACGYGRHTIPFAKAGHSVVGLDLNQYFLKLAKEYAEKEGVKIEFIERDMRDIPFENEFDIVTNLFTAFGYLETPEEDEKAIKEIYKALKPKGRFIIEINNYLNFLARFQPTQVGRYDDGMLIAYERELDPLTMVMQDRRTNIAPNGAREEHVISVRWYFPRDLKEICGRNGLQFDSLYGENGEEWSLASRRLWMQFLK